jgi:hypothetical protein
MVAASGRAPGESWEFPGSGPSRGPRWPEGRDHCRESAGGDRFPAGRAGPSGPREWTVEDPSQGPARSETPPGSGRVHRPTPDGRAGPGHVPACLRTPGAVAFPARGAQRDGGVIDVRGTLDALARRCERAGVRVRRGERVRSVEPDGTGVTVRTDAAAHRAGGVPHRGARAGVRLRPADRTGRGGGSARRGAGAVPGRDPPAGTRPGARSLLRPALPSHRRGGRTRGGPRDHAPADPGRPGIRRFGAGRGAALAVCPRVGAELRLPQERGRCRARGGSGRRAPIRPAGQRRRQGVRPRRVRSRRRGGRLDPPGRYAFARA